MQDALGRSKLERYYAFVETTEGDLAELLVANGLARVSRRRSAAGRLALAATRMGKAEAARARGQAVEGRRVGRADRTHDRAHAEAAAEKRARFFRCVLPPGEAGRRAGSRSDGDAVPVEPTPSPSPSSLAALTAMRSTSPTPTAPAASAADKLDMNAATQAELLAVPGIGPVLAQRIIEGRPYQDCGRSAESERNRAEKIRANSGAIPLSVGRSCASAAGSQSPLSLRRAALTLRGASRLQRARQTIAAQGSGAIRPCRASTLSCRML